MKKAGIRLSGLLLAVITLMFTGCGGDATTPAVLSVSTASLPAATVGNAYSQSLAAIGGTAPYSWSVSVGTLPAGLNLNPATGVISGTPTAAVTANFTVMVTDSASPAGTATQPLTLAVATPAALSITTASPLAAGTVGTVYGPVTLVATGGTTPYAWTVAAGSALPAGLTLSAAGVISGTPTAAGTVSTSITVTDAAAGTVSKAFSITVNPAGALVTVTTASPLPAATFGTAYSQPLAASGGTSPYTWVITAGTLPTNLTLSSAGVISGTPLVSGPFSVTVRASDSAVPANTATQILALTVNISASVLSGKTIYDANCAGCHNLGIYDTTGGSPNLGVTTLAAINARFSGGASHNGNTMTATQITDMFAFVSLF